ncbi:P-loop containing nucleoside triphosphate hydrolase protein [Aspergillus neoniger CBS 115656]|uniref:DNA 3'-5' helicase n=1 Tax=Aspergillus neoniger (strain CBS 115656) TaxID=1448310 RepID=A0A318YID0_ASPNB|nr:P-loop containing nucleoside triphosphate hydrolase protein [Aspergillus neoniger CBS 115656]PYH28098.1 P-loop containing nucleoside triphosphate hydrolase protein [Aspergillus neoniger CBS 115656]
MTAALQQMMGDPGAQLRGVQAEALQAIQDGESPVVTVMRTGGGKSLLFMLPAFLEPGGTTIVIVPLLSLRQDLRRRCQALGLVCVEWESRNPPDDATIVLVTPESTEHSVFHAFLNRLRVQHRLDRVVIDECHVVLHNQSGFRSVLHHLGHLTRVQTQFVYLTATLPPTEEERLCERLEQPRDGMRLIRDRTSRANIAYVVWRPVLPRKTPPGPHAWLESETVLAYLRRVTRRAQGGKVIIYANLVSQVSALARSLDCPAYHGKQVDRPGLLRRFTEGHTPVLAATSALGMGVDVPDIRCIVHVGWPRSLLDYAQESGRAGRDGQRSLAIIIHPAGEDQVPSWLGAVPAVDGERVRDYLQAPCRRRVLDRYLDGAWHGHLRESCQDYPTDLPCDRCRLRSTASRPGTHGGLQAVLSTGASQAVSPDAVDRPRSPRLTILPSQAATSRSPSTSPSPSPSLTPPAPALPREPSPLDLPPVRTWARPYLHAQQQIVQRRLTEEDVAEEAPQWQEHCYICTMNGGDGQSHALYFCPQRWSRRAREWMLFMRNRIQYPRYRQCYQCGMPQNICAGWQEGEPCNYRGILLPMVAMMLYGPWVDSVERPWAQRLASQNIDHTDWQAVCGYLGQPGLPGHNRLFDEYCWLRGVCRELEGPTRAPRIHSGKGQIQPGR